MVKAMAFRWGRSVLVTLALCTLVLGARANTNPREMIQQRVDQLTSRIEAERERLENDEGYAREMVREEVTGLVDFKRITRLVMAEHFSEASREQKYRFLEVFRDSLINTYASGLTLYDDQKVRVLPEQEGDIQGDRARVRMEIHTDDGKVIPVSYSLYRDGEGAWKVQNVIVNGLNLGKIFRSQFQQAVEQYSGDIDKVIDNWSTALDVEGKPGEEGETGAAEQG